VKFINKIELYEPLHVLLVWVTLIVFEFCIAIFYIIEVEFNWGQILYPKKYRLIELRMQGGYPKKIEFYEIV
jgi:hypothetical protein